MLWCWLKLQILNLEKVSKSSNQSWASGDLNDSRLDQWLTAKNLAHADVGLQAAAFAVYPAACSWWIRCVCGNPGCWAWLWAVTRGRLRDNCGWLQCMTKWPQTTVGWSKPLCHSWRRRSTLRPLPYLSGLLVWWIIRVTTDPHRKGCKLWQVGKLIHTTLN